MVTTTVRALRIRPDLRRPLSVCKLSSLITVTTHKNENIIYNLQSMGEFERSVIRTGLQGRDGLG